MLPKETCTHTMQTYTSLSSCWHPKQMDHLPHGLTPAAALTPPHVSPVHLHPTCSARMSGESNSHGLLQHLDCGWAFLC